MLVPIVYIVCSYKVCKNMPKYVLTYLCIFCYTYCWPRGLQLRFQPIAYISHDKFPIVGVGTSKVCEQVQHRTAVTLRDLATGCADLQHHQLGVAYELVHWNTEYEFMAVKMCLSQTWQVDVHSESASSTHGNPQSEYVGGG